MSDSSPYYMPIEIKSYLPSGWTLVDGAVPPRRRGATWAARVIDVADTEWSLELAPRDVEKHGRLGALRREIDRVFREALG